MTTERTEYVKYSREELEEMAKKFARMKLVGNIYYGTIDEETTRWSDDGSVEVFIRHTPSERRK